MTTSSLIDIILWQSLAIFLLLGALLGILLGLLLIFRPQSMHAVNGMANRWISTRHLNQMLDRSVSVEHWFYHHHRPVGMAAVLGATYILIYFGLLFDREVAVRHLGNLGPVHLFEGLLDALVLSSLLGAAVAFMVGLFLWLRPSLLRDIEVEANRWVSTRRATKVLDVPRDQVDRMVERHARRVGWLLLLGSLYLFFVMARWLV